MAHVTRVTVTISNAVVERLKTKPMVQEFFMEGNELSLAALLRYLAKREADGNVHSYELPKEEGKPETNATRFEAPQIEADKDDEFDAVKAAYDFLNS